MNYVTILFERCVKKSLNFCAIIVYRYGNLAVNRLINLQHTMDFLFKNTLNKGHNKFNLSIKSCVHYLGVTRTVYINSWNLVLVSSITALSWLYDKLVMRYVSWKFSSSSLQQKITYLCICTYIRVFAYCDYLKF